MNCHIYCISKSWWHCLKNGCWNYSLLSLSTLLPPPSSSTQTIAIVSNLSGHPHFWFPKIILHLVASMAYLKYKPDHFSAQNTSNLPWPSNLIEAPTHPCVSITSFCFVVLALTSLWNYIVHVFISLLSVSLPILPLENIRNTSPLRIGTLPVLLIIVFPVLRTLLGT